MSIARKKHKPRRRFVLNAEQKAAVLIFRALKELRWSADRRTAIRVAAIWLGEASIASKLGEGNQ